MRRMFMLMVMGLMLAGSAVASAQFVDPSTGIPVDPATDPMDFVNAMSGQPTNIGMEIAAQAATQAQAMAAQQMQTTMQTTSSLFPANDDSNSTPVAVKTKVPPLPRHIGAKSSGHLH